MAEKITKSELLELLNTLEPKIKKSLWNTRFQDQEDLEQDIKVKILESYEKIADIKVPNFEQFLGDYLSNEKKKS
ncbi:hypothetical protein ABEV54_10300 [Peribacillus psychrosaccharolyticus]|uniref:hypothetical protein n=1 Tax=Peribacillus psychrosaccharolyticus TaxID=1407 RepID=UPI00030A7FFF|nr:hypothetical protein [Peribacillus psychrosaccharolyticus]MEC2055721.1 hypothetical protein [Peribacillus psychrosaccharolyticus]MED3743252.1 hypothetical protein [Peribacillus psychrosaccharolyticus]